ncbi:MAG: response regulator [Raoultibacter sp.]
MTKGYTILVVEDDAAVRNLMATTLDLHGYQHKEVINGAQALLELSSRTPDVLVLDLGLPDTDGVDIIRTLRGWSNLPIIVLSARLADADKVEALDAGADDYLVKPFSVEEMLARLRVALRRVSHEEGGVAGEAVYHNGELCIDYAASIVTLAGQEIHLTPIEYRLLCLLAKNTGKVLTHNYILKEVWGAALASDIPSLRVFMATLRKKIETDPARARYLQTHVGVGYRMTRVEE